MEVLKETPRSDSDRLKICLQNQARPPKVKLYNTRSDWSLKASDNAKELTTRKPSAHAPAGPRFDFCLLTRPFATWKYITWTWTRPT